MKLTFLGIASALSNTGRKYNSNILIERNGQKLLFDCGSDIPHALEDAGVSPLEIDGIYLSHLHGDHIGGLEWFGFMRFFHPDSPGRPKLFMHPSLEERLWQYLSVPMGVLSFHQLCTPPTLRTFFDVQKIVERDSVDDVISTFNWADMSCDMVFSRHVQGPADVYVNNYGLLLVTDDKDDVNVYISGDSRNVADFIWKASVDERYWIPTMIFHDCELLDPPSGVHTHYNELKELDDDLKKITWLYHYQPYLADKLQWWEDGFAGMAQKGQVIEVHPI